MKVSVVIATYDRAKLLQRAIRSVLEQTLSDFEVVVVIDGQDDQTLAMLAAIGDARIRWLVLPGRSGPAVARNAGIQAATGVWIAFLDDDDEWMPQKLERQVEAAVQCKSEFPIISTRLIVRRDDGDLHWPRRNPRPHEPICEYLFCRSGLSSGDGQLITSAIMASRELLLACPFNGELRKHEDTEWYLRADATPGTSFIIVPELLTIWHQSLSRARVSRSSPSWKVDCAWARSCRSLMTRKAYASFVLTEVASDAADVHDVWGLLSSYYEAFRFGSPRFYDLLLPIIFAFLPRGVRQKLSLFKESVRHGVRKPRLADPAVLQG